MIDISAWLQQFLQKLELTFGDRVWFVGLQGSYSRGEATENSDIDVVVIFDELSTEDILMYHTMLDGLPNRSLICGFVSGKNELFHWDPADLFQFYHDTTPIKGSLDDVLLLIDDRAVSREIKIGACNIFHGCVHNMLHEKNEEALKGFYKAASFVVQAIAFQETGHYIRRLKELRLKVSCDEQRILDVFLHLKNGGDIDFIPMSETLFDWAKKWISKT